VENVDKSLESLSGKDFIVITPVENLWIKPGGFPQGDSGPSSCPQA
jgi:hypothetical protein